MYLLFPPDFEIYDVDTWKKLPCKCGITKQTTEGNKECN